MMKEEQKLNLNPVVIADILKKKFIFHKPREEEMMDFELTNFQQEHLHSSECVTSFDEDGTRQSTTTPISDGEMPERNSPFEPNGNSNQVEVVDDVEEDVNENGNLCVKITDVFSIFKNWFMRWVVAIPLFIFQVKTFIFHLIRCSGENKEEQDVQEYDATGDIFELLYNKKDDQDPDNNSLESLESEKTIINGKYYKPVAK